MKQKLQVMLLLAKRDIFANKNGKRPESCIY